MVAAIGEQILGPMDVSLSNWTVRPSSGCSVVLATHTAAVSVDGYTLTLAANPWNIVRTYNLTPGRELLFACRYRLGTASNFVVYMSEADNVYDPLYGSFAGDQGAWSTAKMYFTVLPNGVAKLHFGAHFQAPGLPNQTAGTVDVYGLQILDATLEAGNTAEEDTAASALLLKHEFLDGGADDVTLATLGEVLLEPTLTTLGNFLARSNSQSSVASASFTVGGFQLEGYAMTLSAFAWNIVRTYTLTPGRRYSGTASNLVMYVSAADNDYVGVTGTFLGTPSQGVWSTARLDFSVPPGGIAKLHFGAFGGSIPGLVQQSAGTLDLYSTQIRASAFEGESVSVTDLLADLLALTGSATLDGLTAQGNVGCDQLLCNDVNCTDVFTTGVDASGAISCAALTAGTVAGAALSSTGAVSGSSLSISGVASVGLLSSATGITGSTLTINNTANAGNFTTVGDVSTGTLTASGAATAASFAATGAVTGATLTITGAASAGPLDCESLDCTFTATSGGVSTGSVVCGDVTSSGTVSAPQLFASNTLIVTNTSDFSDDLFLTKNWAGWSKLQVSNNSAAPDSGPGLRLLGNQSARVFLERDGGAHQCELIMINDEALVQTKSLSTQLSLTTNQRNPGCLVIAGNTGNVVCNTSFTNLSDSRVKTEMAEADVAELKQLFDSVQAKQYKRPDMNEDLRLGFASNDFSVERRHGDGHPQLLAPHQRAVGGVQGLPGPAGRGGSLGPAGAEEQVGLGSCTDSRSDLDVTQAMAFKALKADVGRQVQAPRPRALGKSAAEGPNDRLQADLIDFSQNTRGKTKYGLVVMDVFTREAAVEPLQNKNAETVGRATRRAARELTGDDGNFVVTTDLGNEFATLDRELPADAVHRTKRPKDRNAIAVFTGSQSLRS